MTSAEPSGTVVRSKLLPGRDILIQDAMPDFLLVERDITGAFCAPHPAMKSKHQSKTDEITPLQLRPNPCNGICHDDRSEILCPVVPQAAGVHNFSFDAYWFTHGAALPESFNLINVHRIRSMSVSLRMI